jgi:prophage DNA circulation protein
MGWRDNYRPASFRGVPFYVDSHDASFGRRTQSHEYPGRDEPYTEDLGRKQREFTIDAYVIGDDYFAARDALIAAVEQLGAGTLVHPYLGELQVDGAVMSLRESTAEGRMARIQLRFVEAGKNTYPAQTSNPLSSISSARNSVLSSSKSGFLSKYITDGMPSYVLNTAKNQVTKFTDFFQSSGISPTGEAQSVAAFFYDVRKLSTSAASVINTPTTLADSIGNILSDVPGIFGSKSSQVLSGIKNLFSGDESSESTGTPSRRQEAKNSNAFGGLIRQQAIATNAVQLANDSQTGVYETREDVVAARDVIIDDIDVESELATTPDDVYRDMQALRSEVVRGVPSESLRLPSSVEYVPPATLPSLLIAQILYGDANRAEEIVARNNPDHPAFIRGGRAIQVLNNV